MTTNFKVVFLGSRNPSLHQSSKQVLRVFLVDWSLGGDDPRGLSEQRSGSGLQLRFCQEETGMDQRD